MIGFVIGNGPSRKNFDLDRLKNKGIIVGCNALYRDFNPDYLAFVDNAMGKELEDKYSGIIVGQRPLQKVKARFLLHKPKYRNSARSSGALATDFIISKEKCDKIYWFGFDNPKDTPFVKASIYAKTPNYQRGNKKWGYSCFIKEYKEILSYWKDTVFYNVIREGVSNPMIEELGSFSNYNVITYEDLPL